MPCLPCGSVGSVIARMRGNMFLPLSIPARLLTDAIRGAHLLIITYCV